MVASKLGRPNPHCRAGLQCNSPQSPPWYRQIECPEARLLQGASCSPRPHGQPLLRAPSSRRQSRCSRYPRSNPGGCRDVWSNPESNQQSDLQACRLDAWQARRSCCLQTSWPLHTPKRSTSNGRVAEFKVVDVRTMPLFPDKKRVHASIGKNCPCPRWFLPRRKDF